MDDDYEISEVLSDFAATFVYTKEQALEAFEDMLESFPFAGIARRTGDEHAQQWYVAGGKSPLVLLHQIPSDDEPDIEKLTAENAALRRGIERHGFQIIPGNYVHKDGSPSPLIVLPKSPEKIVKALASVIEDDD